MPSALRTPILATSPCAMTAVASSSPSLNLTPSSTLLVLLLVAKAKATARVVLASRMTTIRGQGEAVTVFPNSSSNSNSHKHPTTLPTSSETHTWMPPDHQSGVPPLASATMHKADTLPLISSAQPALTTSLFATKEQAPVRGSAVPATTKELPGIPEDSTTQVFATRTPAAMPPSQGVPSSLKLGHPPALHPGVRAEKENVRSTDELDRVLSMYCDRRSPVKQSNTWF